MPLSLIWLGVSFRDGGRGVRGGAGDRARPTQHGEARALREVTLEPPPKKSRQASASPQSGRPWPDRLPAAPFSC